MRALGACLAFVLAFTAAAAAQWTLTLQRVLARRADPGFVATGDAGIRLARRLQLTLGAQNYRFTSRFRDDFSFPSTPVYRSEWLALSGLRLEL